MGLSDVFDPEHHFLARIGSHLEVPPLGASIPCLQMPGCTFLDQVVVSESRAAFLVMHGSLFD